MMQGFEPAPSLLSILRLAGSEQMGTDAGGGRTTLLADAVGAATDVAPGILGCSLTELDGPLLRTAITTADFCRDLDELQYRDGTGPCVRAARDRQRQHVADLDDEPGGAFTRSAQERGVRSVLSLPVQSPHRPTGLNFYNSLADGFGERLYLERAELLSRTVSAILVGRRPGTGALIGLPDDTRELVIRARAKLMEEHGWSSQRALDWLMRTSAREHRSLFEVASEMVGGVAP